MVSMLGVVDRKNLSEMAVNDPEAFSKLLQRLSLGSASKLTLLPITST